MNEQLAELLDASVTLKIFVVMPVGKLEPLARPAVWIVVCPEQLSVPVGAVISHICSAGVGCDVCCDIRWTNNLWELVVNYRNRE